MRAAVVLLAVGSLACASRDVAGPALTGTEWVLTALRGSAPMEGSRTTLGFDAESAGGYGGCNWYGSVYRAEGSSIRFPEIESTLRACDFPRGVGEQEQQYFAALSAARSAERAGHVLLLRDAAGDEVLRFELRVPATVDPAALVGSEWSLRSIAGRPDVWGVTLRFPSASALEGFAGCRNFRGTYTASGDRLRLTSLSMNELNCEDDAALLEEGRFTTALSEADHYRLQDRTLEIVTAGGSLLIFSRE